MATLTVTQTEDYRDGDPAIPANTTEIVFSGFGEGALFNSSQFGGTGISTDVAIDGNFNSLAWIRVYIEGVGTSFSAEAWTFSEWFGNVSVVGSTGNDTIVGSSGSDDIQGAGGADSLSGGGGQDYFVYGGNWGTETGDSIDGGADIDAILIAGSPTAQLDFRSATITGTEVVWLRDVPDTTTVTFSGSQLGAGAITHIAGDTTSDHVQTVRVIGSNVDLSVVVFLDWGGVTEQTIVIQGVDNSANTLTGSSWHDSLFGGTLNDTINGGAGHDTLNGGAGNDALDGGAGLDVNGAPGNDTLNGGAGNDALDGGAGNDTLNGGAGDDTLNGGAGHDTYVMEDGTASVSDSDGFDAITSTITRSLASFGTIEQLILLGTAAINGTGNALANTITGNAAANILSGGAGADDLRGLGGNDTYVMENGVDAVSDTGGVDTITSTITRSLASFGTIERLTLLGTAAINGTGNGLANIITGNAAANVMNGGLGNDTLIGGLGNDTYVLENGADVVADSGGIDFATSTITRNMLAGGLATVERMTILSGNAGVTGNNLNNTITGSTGANILSGGVGNDILIGGLGADTLIGGLGNDTYVLENGADVVADGGGIDLATTTIARNMLAGGLATVERMTILSGNAAVTGNNLNNTITGSIGANVLSGGVGNDILIGGAGNDTLSGGVGIDTLTGNAGNDFFLFNAPLNIAHRDVITDFFAPQDTIRLENAVMTKVGPAGLLNAAAFFAGVAAHDADDRIVYNKVNGALSYDSNGNLAGGVTLLATLTNKPTLTFADFVVI